MKDSEKLLPPTNLKEALKMVEPLDPALPKGSFTAQEMDTAYFRLIEFLRAILPDM